MTKRKLFPIVWTCLFCLCSFANYAQKSKSFSILEPEPIFEPNSYYAAFGGSNFATLTDGSTVFLSDFYGKVAVVHADKSNNLPWSKFFTFDNNQVNSVIVKPTPDGGFLVKMGILGTGYQAGNKFILAKFTAQNVLQWTKTIQFDENTTSSVNCYNLAIDGNGNVLLTGITAERNGINVKYFYLFLNANGGLIRSFFTNETYNNIALCGRREGGFAAIMFLKPVSSNQYRFLLFDAQGQLTSSKAYLNVKPSEFNGFGDIIQKIDGGFVAAGSTTVVQFDNGGNYLKALKIQEFPNVTFGFVLYSFIYLAADGSVILPGSILDLPKLYPAFFVYKDDVTAHYLESETNQAFNIALKSNILTLSTSNFRFFSPTTTTLQQPALNVKQYAINTAFDKTDCGLALTKAVIPSELFPFQAINIAELRTTNLNSIITTVTNGSLQLTNFNISHNVLCNAVGVNDVNLDESISINPNPSHDVFRIKSDNQNADLQRLTIYDNLGQVIMDKVKPSWDAPISIEQTGTYIVRLQTDKGMIQKKIVKVD
jgi:hypothetical protein